MRFTPVKMAVVFVGFAITPGALAAMVIVEHTLGIGSPYRKALGLISGLGTFTAVGSLIMITLRYPEVIKRSADWLQRHRKLYFFGVLPILFLISANLSKCLGS
ncbi:hypothetical protein G3T14_14300 [Methylobacterium sp. BTF04]|uniref:hypothetical protein n=1 Tax=Methylobacterium sp. BTF04 TaxID=2708300 RepID=UPI0013D11C41|nr:hypothetical protein [Methylobacterium sp. BTF04]NEU13293.1 hypothetical protein [Methylobacterium sp. BTF04]